jgi:hypothetical protein
VEEWKYLMGISGELFVMINGLTKMLVLFVGSWASVEGPERVAQARAEGKKWGHS